ncbi:uncharacterized protein LOC126750184 [Anthonomus grandis grandis]|uniref:uncharacterized protein LOC126750184 n=1 Tax=Anthonomus grandis grandis TaxID=2921223 RepID=UPI0021658912|nr:uncharacterized protein LOC126750184 [Anthonomus grandis grandis]
MIPRETTCYLLVLASCLLISTVQSQGERAYDTSDWIPITSSSVQSSASEIVEQKIASDRVLSLESPEQKFFPDEQYQRPNQVQQFIAVPRKPFDYPRPRKLKHPSDYKYEIPPPPPSKALPQINYYNAEQLVSFSEPSKPKYYEISNQPSNKYAPVPSVNPQVPSIHAQSIYEQYQLPFNNSFYQSLNPAAINNDFYQAVNKNTEQKVPVERENVQLVYVPVENLSTPHKEPPNIPPKAEQLVYNSSPAPLYNPVQETLVASNPKSDNKQARLQTIQQDFIQQALQAHKLQQQLRDDINPIQQEIISTTTPKPRKKPHQPPLAVFLESGKKAEISDVLNILKDAKSISVQDSISQSSPQIFIGPSNLESPEGYTKFPLPYLNNVNGNRIERKIDQLPFFVAPVSYKAPPGYAKISLPSPHVGSVVVSIPSPISSTTPHPQLDTYNFNLPQQNILNGYDIVNENSNLYQSTPEPPSASTRQPQHHMQENSYNTRHSIQNSYSTSQPDLYYVQEPQIYNSQTYEPKQEPVRSTTQLPNINPLELAINEFELHQINEQTEEHNKVKHSTTRRPLTRYDDSQTVSSTRAPTSRGRFSYENDQTTERAVSRGRVRGRGRGSTTTTTSTTPISADRDRYTVLEEFVARRPSTESYQELGTEAPRRSTPGFKGNPYLPEQAVEVDQRPAFDNAQYETPTQVRQQPNVQIENIPANVYSLGQTTYENENFNRPGLTYTKITDESFEEKQVTTEAIDSGFEQAVHPQGHRFSPEVVSYENREPVRHRPSEEPVQRQRLEEIIKNPVQSSQQKEDKSKSAFLDNLFQPNFDQAYISLQDQAVRSLLVPNLLAPSSKEQDSPSEFRDSEINQQAHSTESAFIETSPSTEPTTTTTTKTPRSRGRGRSRITTTTTNSPRRGSNRRRPGASRTSTTVPPPQPNTDDYYSEDNIRFRPRQNEITDRISTTENDVRFYGGANMETNNNNANQDKSFIQFEDQQTITIKPTGAELSEKTSGAVEYENSREQSNPVLLDYENIREQSRLSVSDYQTSRLQPRPPASEYENVREQSRPAVPDYENTRVQSRPAIPDYENIREQSLPPVADYDTTRVQPQPPASKYGQSRLAESGYENTRTQPRPAVPDYQNIREQSQPAKLEYENTRLQSRPEVSDYENTRVQPLSVASDDENIGKQTRPAKLEHENTKIQPHRATSDYENIREQPRPVVSDDEIIKELPRPTELEVENSRVQSYPTVSDYGNTRLQSRPVATDDRIPNKSSEEDNYIRHNANIKSGGVINNRKSETTTVRTRGRTRGRSRFATSTTTFRPVTRISTRPTALPARVTTTEEPESYGFTRQPSYTPSNLNIQAKKPVQFVGEIRPKYTRPTAASSVEEKEEVETPRPRIRSRTRVPTKKPTSNIRQSENVINRSTEQVTRRSGSTTRTRGRTHYRPQENVKRESDDEDVANQNYPLNFLQKLESSSLRPLKEFRVTVDPLDEEDDQSPHPSLFSPKFVPKPNSLPTEGKPNYKEKTEILLATVDPEALAVSYTTTEDSSEVTESEINKVMEELEKIQTFPTEEPSEVTTKIGRRRGIWKLVRAKPLDPLEVSESQNYETVLNAFGTIEKVDPYAKSTVKEDKWQNFKEMDEDITTVSTINTEANTEAVTTEPRTSSTLSTTKTQENIFDAIYEMFGVFKTPENATEIIPTTTISTPTFPEEITEEEVAATDSTTLVMEEVKSSTKPYEVEPWQMREVKTSTSTEVSHETEICYKGRCVKSKDKKKIK